MNTIDSPSIIEFPGMTTVVVRAHQHPFNELPTLMDLAFTRLQEAIQASVITPGGPAFSRHERVPAATVDVEVGFPVDHVDRGALSRFNAGAETELLVSELPACRLAITQHYGSYNLLGQAWGAFITALNQAEVTTGLPLWEAYDTEPTPEMDPADLVTGLAIPVTSGRFEAPAEAAPAS